MTQHGIILKKTGFKIKEAVYSSKHQKQIVLYSLTAAKQPQ